MFETRTIGTERRRSQRMPLSIPVDVVSFDSSPPFRGRCNTIDVSFHGCQFFITRPFKHGARLLLDILNTHHTATAYVVRVMPAVPDMKVMLWKIGVALDLPSNYWGVETPPPDWVW